MPVSTCRNATTATQYISRLLTLNPKPEALNPKRCTLAPHDAQNDLTGVAATRLPLVLVSETDTEANG